MDLSLLLDRPVDVLGVTTVEHQERDPGADTFPGLT